MPHSKAKETSYLEKNVVGPLLGRVRMDYDFGPFERIQQTDDAELYIFRYPLHKGAYDVGDPELKFITKDDVLVTLGLTGLLSTVQKVEEEGTLTDILNVDQHGNFHLERENLPVDGVADNSSLTDEQIIPLIIDYVYEESRKVPDDKENTLSRLFHYWTAEAFVSRFRDFKSLIGDRDIIPDHSHLTVPVKLSERCPHKCIYCPEGGDFEPKTREQIIESIKVTREVQMIYHSKAIGNMIEGFFNNADLLWFTHPKYKHLNVDSIALTRYFKRTFPEVEKLGSFFSVHNIIRMRDEYKAEFGEEEGQIKLKEWFTKLRKAGLNRGYIGIETAHDDVSRLLGKSDTYQDKLYAIKLLQEAGILVKAIIQVGLGEEFLKPGKEKKKENYVTNEASLKRTIDLMNEAQPYRVMISEFVPYDNLKIFEYYADERIKQYKNPREGIQREIEYLIKGINLEPNGQIEHKYQQFLPKKGQTKS